MSLVGVGQCIGGRFQAKAATILLSLETRLDRILLGWLVSRRPGLCRTRGPEPSKEPLGLHILAPYLLLVCAPVVSIGLALRWFADGDNQPQPEFRLAR